MFVKGIAVVVQYISSDKCNAKDEATHSEAMPDALTGCL